MLIETDLRPLYNDCLYKFYAIFIEFSKLLTIIVKLVEICVLNRIIFRLKERGDLCLDKLGSTRLPYS